MGSPGRHSCTGPSSTAYAAHKTSVDGSAAYRAAPTFFRSARLRVSIVAMQDVRAGNVGLFADGAASAALSNRIHVGDIFVAVAVEIDVGFH